MISFGEYNLFHSGDTLLYDGLIEQRLLWG